MTREEAIAILRQDREGICTDIQCTMTMYRDYSGVDKCNQDCEEREAYDMAIEALSAEAKTKCIAQIKVDTEEIVKRIKEEYDITDGWIPCSERLPEKDEIVLVSYKTMDTVHMCKYLDDGSENPWWSYNDDCLAWNNVILAWMPLPKPYKGGDTE